jgi:DNA-directed RNA polymerase subunit RPC12/RpoP
MERFSYLAIYSCKECNAEDNLPRAHHMHRGKAARCPKCGTFRIKQLKEPDQIDPMHTGVLNMIEKMVGGKLFHCRFCRIQFWDRRRLQSEVLADEAAAAKEAEDEAAGQTETAPPDADEHDA